jgi:predicted nucleic acid-binding protein
MTRRILDTSVAVAWYLPEPWALSAREWRRRFMSGEVELLVPHLHLYEFGNVLRKYVLLRDLDAPAAEGLYGLHLECPLRFLDPPPQSLLSTALEYGATLYDAVYIALALEHQVPLLTAERTTTAWVTRLGRLAEVCA